MDNLDHQEEEEEEVLELFLVYKENGDRMVEISRSHREEGVVVQKEEEEAVIQVDVVPCVLYDSRQAVGKGNNNFQFDTSKSNIKAQTF